MEIINAIRLVAPAPDSQYRLRACGCGNDQPVYVVGRDGKWRVMCLDCKKETEGFGVQHDAQLEWNKEVVYELHKNTASFPAGPLGDVGAGRLRL